MAIQITWDNTEQTIFCYHFDEKWTWDEFFAAKEAANILMDTLSHKFAVIVDASATTILPIDLLANMRRGVRTKHASCVAIALVIRRPVIRTMISSFQRITPMTSVPIQVASTLDEARVMVIPYLQPGYVDSH